MNALDVIEQFAEDKVPGEGSKPNDDGYLGGLVPSWRRREVKLTKFSLFDTILPNFVKKGRGDV
jgi:hypothetical protein